MALFSNAPASANEGTIVRRRFDVELSHLLEEMVQMGVVCTEMLQTAIDALQTQDSRLIAQVLQQDDALDVQALRIEVDAQRLLTLHQPVLSGDLRFVMLALRAGTDLERIGDHCVNIARVAGRMSNENVIFQPLIDVERMKVLVTAMLSDMVTALVKRDIERAQRVMEADDEVDVLYKEMRRQLRQVLLDGSGNDVVRATHLLFVAHYLERMGDHCVGIAERIVFVETGSFDTTAIPKSGKVFST